MVNSLEAYRQARGVRSHMASQQERVLHSATTRRTKFHWTKFRSEGIPPESGSNKGKERAGSSQSYRQGLEKVAVPSAATPAGASCGDRDELAWTPPNPHQDQIEKVVLVQFKLKKMVCPPSHVSMTKVQISVSNLQHRPAIRFEIFSWHQLNWMTHPFIWKYSGSQKFLLTPIFDTCQGRWFLWRGGGRFRRNKKLHSVGIGRWSPSDGPEEYALKMLIR